MFDSLGGMELDGNEIDRLRRSLAIGKDYRPTRYGAFSTPATPSWHMLVGSRHATNASATSLTPSGPSSPSYVND